LNNGLARACENWTNAFEYYWPLHFTIAMMIVTFMWRHFIDLWRQFQYAEAHNVPEGSFSTLWLFLFWPAVLILACWIAVRSFIVGVRSVFDCCPAYRAAYRASVSLFNDDLASWAQALSPAKQQKILTEFEDRYQAQDWESALMQGKALAVARAVQMKYDDQAELVIGGAPERAVLVDDTAVQELVGLGFTESRAQMAVQIVEGSTQQRVEWLLEHGNLQDDVKDCPYGAEGWKCGCGVEVALGAHGRHCTWQMTGFRCDGCDINLISGLRWRCTKCRDFDYCDDCYTKFRAGELIHPQKLDHYASTKRRPLDAPVVHDFKEVSARNGSCCNCSINIRWTMAQYDSLGCVKCKGRKASKIFSKLGRAYKRLGQFAIAVEVLEERLSLSEKWEDKDGAMEAHENLAICFRSIGLFEKATWHAEQQLGIAQEHGKMRAVAVAMQQVAESYKSQRKYLLAMELNKECLSIARDLEGEDTVLRLRSNVLQILRFNDSGRNFQGLYPVVNLKEQKNKIFVALAHYNLADSYYHVGKYSCSIEHHEQAREIVVGRAIEMKQ